MQKFLGKFAKNLQKSWQVVKASLEKLQHPVPFHRYQQPDSHPQYIIKYYLSLECHLGSTYISIECVIRVPRQRRPAISRGRVPRFIRLIYLIYVQQGITEPKIICIVFLALNLTLSPASLSTHTVDPGFAKALSNPGGIHWFSPEEVIVARPSALAPENVDPSGRVYIMEYGNHVMEDEHKLCERQVMKSFALSSVCMLPFPRGFAHEARGLYGDLKEQIISIFLERGCPLKIRCGRLLASACRDLGIEISDHLPNNAGRMYRVGKSVLWKKCTSVCQQATLRYVDRLAREDEEWEKQDFENKKRKWKDDQEEKRASKRRKKEEKNAKKRQRRAERESDRSERSALKDRN
jgi:hypothetical protein